MTLPKFDNLKRNVEARQLVTATYQDQTITFEGQISANKDRFLMVGLDGFGRRAIEIDWTKDGIKYTSASFVPSQLKAENILADIIILYWPETSVRKSINGKLVAKKNSRSVFINEKEIIQAKYKPNKKDVWDGVVEYKNLEFGYSLQIQSVVAK